MISASVEGSSGRGYRSAPLQSGWQPSAHVAFGAQPIARLISVLICTYSRSSLLRACIESLLTMKALDGLSWELVCVDNNSSDDTRLVVEELARKSRVPIHYLFEARRGKDYALNTGLKHARGEIIAMTDEDCVVDPDWIAAIWREFERDPSLDIVGGRLELYDEAAIPIATRTLRERRAFTLDTLFSLIPGCNLAFRRSVVSAIGMFDPEFGPGGPTGGAEDSDFLYRAWRAQLTIAYSPDLLVYHDHGHRTEADRRKKERQYVIARGVLYAKHIFRGEVPMLRIAYWESAKLLRGAIKHAFGRENDGADLQCLGWLMQGAAQFLRVRFRKLIGRSIC